MPGEMNERQAEFLLAEYSQLAESIKVSMDNENSAFRMLATLTTGAAGAILLAIANKVSTDIIALCSAGLSSVLLLSSALGCQILIASLIGLVRKLRAINAIRRYFLDLDASKATYFQMPVTDSQPEVKSLTIRATIFFALVFVATFCFAAIFSWFIFAGYASSIAAIGGVIATVMFQGYFLVLIRRTRHRINEETRTRSSLAPFVVVQDGSCDKLPNPQ